MTKAKKKKKKGLGNMYFHFFFQLKLTLEISHLDSILIETLSQFLHVGSASFAK